MRILVTGGSGFLGSAFVRAAAAAGHEVAVLSRQDSADRNVRAPGTPPLASNVRLLRGSLAEPPWTEIGRFAAEACVHAAWIATPGVYLESAENHDWVRWSLDFLTRLPQFGVRHITVLGTCIEYQITGQKLVEDVTPLAPASTYARCKCELHDALTVQSSEFKVQGSRFPELAWARIFYPYGNGEHAARLASSLITKLRRGEVVSLRTPRSIKDYIHMDDLATALLSVVERRFNGAINIGTGEGVAVETIARELGALLGRPELIQVPADPPVDPLDYVVADATRLRSLGWQAQVTLEAGLRRLVEARAT
jgi:nucleoside-diphosphate-sugar epimerase